MNIYYYVSIVLQAYSLIAVLTIFYLIFVFYKYTSFTKYLTRQDIDDLYNYNWSKEDLNTLQWLILDRKSIAKMIGFFALSLLLSITIVIGINKANHKDIEKVQPILEAMYTSDVNQIEDNLIKNQKYLSKPILEKLTTKNIDNIRDRYATVSSSQNTLNIVSSIVIGNEQYIEYQILSGDTIISNRRLHVKYTNNVITEFDEDILIPVEYLEENEIQYKEQTQKNKDEDEINETIENQDINNEDMTEEDLK